MTRNIFNIAAMTIAMVLTASCTAESDIMEYETMSAKEETTLQSSDVFAGFSVTRQQVSMGNGKASYKNAWTSEDIINIYNNEKNLNYTVVSEGENASIVPMNGNNVNLNGHVTAVYPSVKFNNGQTSFTLNGQNGTFENLNRYFLMTASAKSNGGNLSLDFTQHITILKFNIDSRLMDGAQLTNATLSGNGICNKIDMNITEGGMNITPAGSNELQVSLTRRGSDNFCYIAFYNTGEDFLLTVNDSEGGEHFINLNVNTLNNGCINEIPTDMFEGGYAIEFGASVADYSSNVYSF